MTASPDPSPSPQALTRYVEDSRALISGNAVKLLRNGAEAFPAWIAAIDDAHKRVSLEMYIFSDDGIGRQFSEALARAAQRGVEVRLLYDFVGCRGTAEAEAESSPTAAGSQPPGRSTVVPRRPAVPRQHCLAGHWP